MGLSNSAYNLATSVEVERDSKWKSIEKIKSNGFNFKEEAAIEGFDGEEEESKERASEDGQNRESDLIGKL